LHLLLPLQKQASPDCINVAIDNAKMIKITYILWEVMYKYTSSIYSLKGFGLTKYFNAFILNEAENLQMEFLNLGTTTKRQLPCWKPDAD